MATKRLTQIGIKNLSTPAKRREIPDGTGLYLVLQPSGVRTWAFRYRRPGDRRPAKLTLGPFRELREGEAEPLCRPIMGDPLTLAQARSLAGQVQLGVAVKEDPAAAKKRAKVAEKERGDSDHFEIVAKRFLERYARPKNKASTFGENLSLLGFKLEQNGEKLEIVSRSADQTRDPRPAHTWPAIRWKGRKLQSINKLDVIELLDAIVDAGVPHAANSTLAAVRKLFNWCIERGELAVSPCAGVKKPIATVERERVLADHELRLVWLGAGEMGWPFGHLVKLLILTGARRDEWAEGRCSEIGHNSRLFHLPSPRTKNGLAHDIPLAPQTIAVLTELAEHRLKGEPNWLFSTGTGRASAAASAPLRPISGFSKAKRRLDATILAIARREAEEAGVDPDSVRPLADWRVHDLRRTAVTGMARLGVAVEVAEKAVNHISGTFAGIVRVYQRHDFATEVRDALECWADGVDRVVGGGQLEPPKLVRLAKRGRG